jgi:ceramide glucosyltransferase
LEIPNLLNTFEVLLLTLCLTSVLFYCYAIYAAFTFFRHPHPINIDFHPPITILKPLCGLDNNTYENLASFCRQDYPIYQIIFSIRDSQDPATVAIKKIINDFPKLDIQLVICDRIIGPNLKISNLANAAVGVKYEILLLADSDIRVGSDYLQRVVQPLQDIKVGVVTCLYRSLANRWVETFEAVGTTCDFHAGVLASHQLESGINYAFGSTIVIRKQVLDAIGGFKAISDYLADDFQLGYLPTQAGYKVVLSDHIVEHELNTIDFINVIKHQLRWARCIRVSRPWGYRGLIFTYGTVASLMLLITTGGSSLAWLVFAIVLVTRLVMSWVVGVINFKDPISKKFFWIVPVYELFRFIIWCWGFLGNTIEWREQEFKLSKDGKLIPISEVNVQEIMVS